MKSEYMLLVHFYFPGNTFLLFPLGSLHLKEQSCFTCTLVITTFLGTYLRTLFAKLNTQDSFSKLVLIFFCLLTDSNLCTAWKK